MIGVPRHCSKRTGTPFSSFQIHGSANKDGASPRATSGADGLALASPAVPGARGTQEDNAANKKHASGRFHEVCNALRSYHGASGDAARPALSKSR